MKLGSAKPGSTFSGLGFDWPVGQFKQSYWSPEMTLPGFALPRFKVPFFNFTLKRNDLKQARLSLRKRKANIEIIPKVNF